MRNFRCHECQHSWSYLTEQVDQGTVHPARVATFEERRETEDMPEELGSGQAGVAWNSTKNITKKRIETNINLEGESHESRFCGSDK